MFRDELQAAHARIATLERDLEDAQLVKPKSLPARPPDTKSKLIDWLLSRPIEEWESHDKVLRREDSIHGWKRWRDGYVHNPSGIAIADAACSIKIGRSGGKRGDYHEYSCFWRRKKFRKLMKRINMREFVGGAWEPLVPPKS